MLQRLATDVSPDRKRDLVEQDALVAVFLGINTIEAFTSIFFRVVAEERAFAHAKNQILEQLNKRLPLCKKLHDWPALAFGRTISKDDPRWQNFDKLRNQRNMFTHFKSSHQSIGLPNRITISGLVDMSLFAELEAETPAHVLHCVRGIVEAVGECRGASPQGFVHLWLGLLD
jgi:hypothetical protein